MVIRKQTEADRAAMDGNSKQFDHALEAVAGLLRGYFDHYVGCFGAPPPDLFASPDGRVRLR